MTSENFGVSKNSCDCAEESGTCACESSGHLPAKVFFAFAAGAVLGALVATAVARRSDLAQTAAVIQSRAQSSLNGVREVVKNPWA